MRGAGPLGWTGGAVPSSPTSPGDFRLQMSSRGDSVAPRSAELQGPCTFCLPLGPICFPPAKSAHSGAGTATFPLLSPSRCGAGRGGGGESQFGQVPGLV